MEAVGPLEYSHVDYLGYHDDDDLYDDDDDDDGGEDDNEENDLCGRCRSTGHQ